MIEQKGQLFYDPLITGLSKKAIEEMVKERELSLLYPIALNHFYQIIPQIENCEIGDLQWLKMEYTVPYFVDLAFRCKDSVYGVIFAQAKENNNLFFPLDLDVSIKLCKENDIIPCILVFDEEKNILPLTTNKWSLIDARSLFFDKEVIPVIPDSPENNSSKFQEMSKWEELNNAVMAYVKDLSESQEISDILYQSYPGVDPSICWLDKEGVFNYMLIRTMKDKEDKPVFDEYVINKLSSTGGKGHLCIAYLSNPNTSGILPRTDKVDIKMEIEDLY